MSITTDVVNSNLDVIKFVSDVRQVGGFLRVLRFPAPIKLPRYNWNIIESGVKHQNQPTNNLTTLPSSVN
jgi:hypothetical protein